MDPLQAMVMAGERSRDARACAWRSRIDGRGRPRKSSQIRGRTRQTARSRTQSSRKLLACGNGGAAMSEESSRPTQRMTIDDLSLHTSGEDIGAAQGPNVVMHTWFQLFRTAMIHAIDNQALQRPVHAMVEMTQTLVAREGQVSFQAKDKSLFVNGTKLRLSTDEYDLTREIFEFFE